MPSMTINISAAQWNRVASAFGKALNKQDLTDPENPVPRDATGAEVKQAVINFIKQNVFDQERIAARQAADAGIADLEAT